MEAKGYIMELFEHYDNATLEDNIEKLEFQVNHVVMPDDMRFRKSNLLMKLYDAAKQYEDSDKLASSIIREGTELVKLPDAGVNTNDILGYVKESYFLRGKRHFDDYMIACEWNRAPQARFWLPRRDILEGKHHIVSKIDSFINDPKKLFLSFSMPPGTGKSTLIKFLMGFIAGQYPMSSNMYVSYSDGMVKMMYDSLNGILTDTFEYAHNDIFDSINTNSLFCSAEYNTISYRKRGDFPTFGLISLGGSVTGRTRANNFLITDDLVKNAEVARSPERLDKLYSDYKSTLTTRRIGDNVKQIMLGTIWSAYDPISRTMAEHENDPRYEFICIPVKDENDNTNFNYNHPDNYSNERIAEIEETLDPVDFSCLYMQTPIEKEGMVFTADALKYYNGVLPDGEPDDIFAVCDVAWGGGDSLSMPVIYVYGDEWYMHDVVFDNRDKFATKPRVAGKILQHNIKSVRFEANNGGDEYADDINKQIRDCNYSCNITHKKAPTNMSKLIRIEQHAPNIKEINFIGREFRNDEYEKFMKEFTRFSFTAKNKHDDAPDSLAMAVDYKMSGTHIGKGKIIKRNGRI